MIADPRRKGGVDEVGECEHRRAEHPAIIVDIIARQRGEGLASRSTATPESLHQDSQQGGGGVGRGKIVLDRRIAGVEQPRRAVEMISVFRNRDADDADGGIGDDIEQRPAIVRSIDRTNDRADQRPLFPMNVPLDQRIETVLSVQRGEQRSVGRSQPSSDDAPCESRRIALHEVVGVPSEMRSMKPSQTDMDDARRDLGRIVARRLYTSPHLSRRTIKPRSD